MISGAPNTGLGIVSPSIGYGFWLVVMGAVMAVVAGIALRSAYEKH